MQNNPSRKIVLLITTACFMAFFIFGFTDNLKGPTLPAMLLELDINYGTGGNIFFGEYVGFLVATLITGLIADRFGLKVVMLLAGFFLALGVGGYSLFPTAGLLALSLFVMGLGLGAFELGPNAIIVKLHHERKGLFLNLMAVLHGLGSMLAPLFAGWLFGLAAAWRAVYRWDLLLVCLFFLLVLALPFPKMEERARLDFSRISEIAFQGQIPWFYAAIAFYVAAEIGTASWLVTFLQQARHASVAASNQSLSLFFGLLTCGRLLGGFFVQRAGYLRSTLIASLGAFLCLAIGLFGPPQAHPLLPAAGFFLSIIFPTLTAAASDRNPENSNSLLGLLFTFAGLGGVAGPWLVGWGSSLFGLRAGFSVNVVLAGLTSLSIFILMKGTKPDGKKT